VPNVSPGGESLLSISGWPKVEKVLQAIDLVEALDIDPADAAPEHWRHVHNRMFVGEQPRPYLPRGVPLIKRILALPDQSVCRHELRIVVDGIDMGAARERDRRGGALPVWQGCLIIAVGEVFLMNWDEPASLDSRYFGPIPISAILGRAKPLWTFEKE
jgi:type IV secretory pathway protease TraF